MAYSVERTDKADEQLRDIIVYRAELSGTPYAVKLLDQFEEGIRQLAEYPESGVIPRYASLRARGYRILIIEKYLVFYKTDHVSKSVMIYAIVDGRRNYLDII